MTTVFCIGRNYAEHAAELNNAVPTEPVVFLKAESALRRPDEAKLAFASETFHHEAELVLKVGRDAALGTAGTWDLVGHLGLGLDLTRREVQTQLKAKGLPWTAAKSFAGAAILTDFLPLAAFANRDEVEFSLTVNGELRQQGTTRDMIFSVPAILTHLLRSHDLRAGDLVYTGTPKGVGPLKQGDRFELAFLAPAHVFRGVL